MYLVDQGSLLLRITSVAVGTSYSKQGVNAGPATHTCGGTGGEKTFDQHTGTAVDANLRRSNL